MDILLAVFLGFLQGVTEWFPVSSSGHLVLAQTYLGAGTVSTQEWIFFDIAVHVASILVVLILFRREILRLVRAFLSIFPLLVKGERTENILRSDPYRFLSVLIVVGTVPAVIMGYAFRRWFEAMFEQPLVVAISLIFTGFVLIMTYGLSGKRIIKDMKFSDALYVGIMQGFAIIPGVSRSGATISTGIVLGIKKTTAAKFSFLLAVPVIFGALVMHLPDMPPFSESYVVPLLAGFVTSFIVGLITLKLLVSLIRKGKFYLFAAYCWVLGAVVLALEIL